MTIEEENAALWKEVDRLNELCALLREECSSGFKHGRIRRSPSHVATPASEPKRSLLDL